MPEGWQARLYGRLRGEQIGRSLDAYRELWDLTVRVQARVRKNPNAFENAGIEVPFPWAQHYQQSFRRPLTHLAMECGMAGDLIEIAKSENPTAAFFERYIDDDESPEQADPGVVYALGCVCNANLRAISLYSKSMSDLVSEFDDPARGDEALRRALWIDPSVLSLPSAISRFVEARNANNQYAFNAFLRALRNGPDKRKIARMELRWLEYLLREMGAFETCSQKEIFDLVVNGLGLYRHDGDRGDAFKALFELFRTWRNPDSK